jgi:hypothetical protein
VNPLMVGHPQQLPYCVLDILYTPHSIICDANHSNWNIDTTNVQKIVQTVTRSSALLSADQFEICHEQCHRVGFVQLLPYVFAASPIAVQTMA